MHLAEVSTGNKKYKRCGRTYKRCKDAERKDIKDMADIEDIVENPLFCY